MEIINVINHGIIRDFQDRAKKLKVSLKKYDATRKNPKTGELYETVQTSRTTYLPAKFDGKITYAITEDDLMEMIDVFIPDKNNAAIIKNLMGLECNAENEPVHVDEPAPKKEEKIKFVL